MERFDVISQAEFFVFNSARTIYRTVIIITVPDDEYYLIHTIILFSTEIVLTKIRSYRETIGLINILPSISLKSRK